MGRTKKENNLQKNVIWARYPSDKEQDVNCLRTVLGFKNNAQLVEALLNGALVKNKSKIESIKSISQI